jgi:hypothetical protein
MGIARSLVYFAYLGEEGTDQQLVGQRLAFLARQLQWLSELIAMSGDAIDPFLSYVAPRAGDAAILQIADHHGFRIDPASLDADRRNRFEYPGFHALKTLAEASAPDDLLYYCHSKGIVELSETKMGLFRLHTAIGLTADLAKLTSDPALTRAGLFPSRQGWCWYNFFWIKAGYMAGLPVRESADRYAFESLIGDHADKQGYRGVLPLIDRLPFAATGIAAQPWYRAADTTSAAFYDTCYAYLAMASPPGFAPGR